MKKAISIIIAIFLFSGIAYCQTDSTQVDPLNEMTKIFGTKILMEVDSQLYNNIQGNFYISDKPQAMIMAMVLPQSYEKAKEQLSIG